MYLLCNYTLYFDDIILYALATIYVSSLLSSEIEIRFCFVNIFSFLVPDQIGTFGYEISMD